MNLCNLYILELTIYSVGFKTIYKHKESYPELCILYSHKIIFSVLKPVRF